MRKSLQISTSVAALAMVVSLTSCAGGGSTPSTSPVAKGTLTIAEAADTTEMDPQVSFYDSSWRLQDLVYDSLVTTDADSQILPSIAESWTENGTSYTFTLREGVTFSNGREMTVEDVVGSLKRITDPALGSYWTTQVGPVTEVTAVDERTVRVDLETPWVQLLPALASTSAAILPMEELEAGTFDPATDMLGTGPFVLASHTQDQSWKFTANEHYWDADNVNLGAVDVRIIPDDAARVGAIRDGSTDIAYFANPDAPTLLQGIPNAEATVQGSSDMYWLVLNTVNPESPFMEPSFREAIATGVNRERVVETALAGTGLPTAVTPAGLPGSCDPAGLPTYDGTPEAAQAVLEAAGIDDAEFELISPPYLSSFDGISQVLQQDWKEAGITANIVTPEMGDYIDRVFVQQPGNFDAVVDYFAGFLYPTMAADPLAVVEGDQGPLSGVIAPSIESQEAVAEARATGTEAAIQQMCEVLAGVANVVPLATKSTTIAVRTDLVDADIPAFDGYDIYLRNITDYSELG